MGHTSEEQWYARREKLRKGVSQYYKAKRIARLLARELGADRMAAIDPYKYDSNSMREMAQLLRRSIHALGVDRKSLGLTAHQHFINVNAWENRVITHGRYYKRDVPGLRREIMSVEELAERMDKMMNRDQEPDFVFPKYHKELVRLKGIEVATGSTRFKWGPNMDNRGHYSGPLLVCHAREIRADWLAEDNIRAFKVVVLPERDKSVYSAATGYVARSTITDEINPAFGEDIAKAVSLCKRRVKAEVMKQMGI
jgi:hypothetical protein